MDPARLHSAISRIRTLPQSPYLPDNRIQNWLERIVKTGQEASLDFHLRRLAGIGGSESGAIVAHYHDSASVMKLEDGFKSADTISREKLLLSAPTTSVYAERGTQVEPVIREIFCRKYSLYGYEDQQASEAVHSHARNKHMHGNVDDVFVKEKRILVDYKSVSANSYSEKIPFSHTTQINHYNENLRSKGMAADRCLTVNLIAEESVFADIIAAYENRVANPGDYEFWVSAIMNDRLTSCRLVIKEIASTPEFGTMISESITRFMEEYPLVGKTVRPQLERTELLGEERRKAAEIESKIFHIISAESALKKMKEEYSQEITNFQKGIGQPFNWPGYFPVSIGSTISLDIPAAIEALELAGINPETIYVPSHSEDYDLAKVLQRFAEIGGELDESLLRTRMDHERLSKSLHEAGLDEADFQVEESPSVRLSRKAINLDQKLALGFELEAALEELIETRNQQEIDQIEEFAIGDTALNDLNNSL